MFVDLVSWNFSGFFQLLCEHLLKTPLTFAGPPSTLMSSHPTVGLLISVGRKSGYFTPQVLSSLNIPTHQHTYFNSKIIWNIFNSCRRGRLLERQIWSNPLWLNQWWFERLQQIPSGQWVQEEVWDHSEWGWGGFCTQWMASSGVQFGGWETVYSLLAVKCLIGNAICIHRLILSLSTIIGLMPVTSICAGAISSNVWGMCKKSWTMSSMWLIGMTSARSEFISCYKHLICYWWGLDDGRYWFEELQLGLIKFFYLARKWWNMTFIAAWC